MSSLKSHRDLLALVMRYGLVGVLAIVVHASISLVLHELVGINPFWANASGVFGGFITAYLGHFHYSFKDQGRHQSRLPKFMFTSLTGLGLQQGGVLLLVNLLHLDYSTQALPLLIVSAALVTFLMSKFWVFR